MILSPDHSFKIQWSNFLLSLEFFTYYPIKLLKMLYCFIKQGEELKKQIGAVAYVECSSKTQQVSCVLICMCSNSNGVQRTGINT